ncbi:MAG: zinc-binding alcohol dehydrogenase [Armatimonas sp.]
MITTALVCDTDQQFAIEEAILPPPRPRQIQLRTLWSGVSFGTELALIRGKLNWGPPPMVTGYMATGIVEAVGTEVTEFAIGDRAYCRNNAGLSCTEGTALTMASGTHAAHITTGVDGTHGAAKLPDGVPADVASLFVLPAVGLHGVDMAQPEVGALVVVHGVGQIGLAVVAACALRGCTVIAIDIDAGRLAVASALGADHLIHAAEEDVAAQVRALAPNGADYVFECTGRADCVMPAAQLCRTFGTFIWQGNYGGEPFPFHFLPMHGKQLRTLFPCDDGYQPCRQWVMKGLANGTLAWEKTLTHRVAASDAPEIFRALNAGELTNAVGAAIHWSRE